MKLNKLQNWIFTIGGIVLMYGPVYSATNPVDSLNDYIASRPNDSIKVDALLELSAVYFGSNLDSARYYAEQAVRLGRRVEYLNGIGYGLKNIGITHFYQGNYVDAVTVWQEAQAVFDSINNAAGVANMLSNIGAVYSTEGDYSKALEFHLKSLKVAEKANDSLRIITALVNIGAAYNDRDATHAHAIKYSQRALNMAEAVKDRTPQINDAIATSAVNIGEVYMASDTAELAVKYFKKALEAMEDQDGRIFVMVSMSKAYRLENNLDSAFTILEEALDLARELELPLNEAYALTEYAKTYDAIGLPDQAIEYYRQAASLSREMNALKKLEDSYGGLYRLYASKDVYDSAYTYQHLYMVIKDSIYNAETEKTLSRQMFNFQIEKKQDEINLQKKDLEIAALDIRKQKVINGLVGAGMLSVAAFLFIALSQKRRITKEKNRSESLLLNILPYEVAEELKEKGESEAKHYDLATVLFTDFKGFTGLSETVTPAELVEVLNFYFKGFDHIITDHKIEKIKTIGDAYMAVGGLPVPNPDALRNVIYAALEMQQLVKTTQEEGKNEHAKKFSMRLGVHTGPVVAGIVGVKKFQYDIWGDTVNTAARMESSGEIGKVNISGDTYELIKDMPEFVFEYRGMVEAKGKGKMKMYFVDYKDSEKQS